MAFLQSKSRWTLAHISSWKIFLCIYCFLLASKCNKKLEKLVNVEKRRGEKTKTEILLMML